MEVEQAKEEIHDKSHAEGTIISQGAEGRIFVSEIFATPCIVKERFIKKYRVPELDTKITKQRITQETRNMARVKKAGVNTPALFFLDHENRKIYMEYLQEPTITVKQFLLEIEDINIPRITESLCQKIGESLAKMHQANIIHGDLTTSNMMVDKESISHEDPAENTCALYLIDFGLSFFSLKTEDKAVDLYVLKRAMISLHPGSEVLFDKIIEKYREWMCQEKCEDKGNEIIEKYKDVELRGRKKICFG
ncbi:unnamed protein product [Moneuplotes crassus]|uniref:non-specific serine/threonine protein kinase n=1 Tax=Euplotes crassus TaxID=5936 RepID=A0AAD1XW55_EUPCR|nr:unnamed protein product [Moneuplotes crassus]